MLAQLTAQIGSRPLGLARILIGVAAAARALVAWPILTKLSDPATLRVPYFEWYPEASTALIVVTLSVWLISAVFLTLGRNVTTSGLLLLASIVFVLGLDQQAYSNHLYLMAWLVLLLVAADSGAGISLGRPDRPVTRWPVTLMKIQLSVVYAFAAITKLNEDFISGRVLAGVMRDGVIEFPSSLRTPSVLASLAVATIFVELYLAFFLWSPRLRHSGFALGAGFHLAIVLLMADTGELAVFALEMLALYPLFLGDRGVTVVWDDDCGSCRDWVTRFKRFDLLRRLEIIGKREATHLVSPDQVEESLQVLEDGSNTWGFSAVTRVMEHLVPMLWVATIFRLPGIRALGERWYRWQARRRSCAVGLRG